MADVTTTYGIDVESNADKAAQGFKLLSSAIDGFTSSGEHSTSTVNGMWKGLNRLETTFDRGPSSVKKYADSFTYLRKSVSDATKWLQSASQDYVVGGGLDVMGSAAKTMNLDEAKEVLAIREAEGLTAEKVAAAVVAADKRKQAADEAYSKAMREGLARLDQIQKDQTAAENAESLKAHNLKMQRLSERVKAEQEAADKIRAIQAQQNASSAKQYQAGFTDPKSFFGQANARDASTGLKASDTTWAKQATASAAFRAELQKTDIEFQKQQRNAELTTLRYAILGRHTEDLSEKTHQAAANLPTLRYAMYDVARTAGVMSAAITGAGVGLLAASSSYETSFTAVERTSGVTGAAVGDLRDDLLGLARVIPQSFGEISDLAARGAQLGVASDNLAGFTETVAQFVATSDTVSLDQAVEAFGRISNLTGDSNFNALGSAITLVGVNAAATEGQIVKTTQELAPFAASVGMASYDVVGLATAVASLGQPAERSRSAFLSLQNVMDGAIGGTNDKLAVFANLLGVTETEATKLWKTDPSAFISAMASALSGVDNMSGALSELGLSEKRASQVFQALAADSRNAGDGLSVLDQALTDSEKGYKDGTELARQYGLIVDDLASKWQLFQNSAMELASALGDNLAPAAKAVLDFITPLIQNLTDMARTPAASWVIGITTTLVALSGALLTGIALWAASKAAIAGAQTALAQLGATGGAATVTLRGLSATLTQTAIAAGASARAVNVFKVALASTGIGLAVVALGTLAAAFMQTGDAAENAFNKYIGSSGGLAEALAADAEAAKTSSGAYTVVVDSLDAVSGASETSAASLAAAAKVLGVDVSASSDTATDSLNTLTYTIGENTLAWMRQSLMASESFRNLADSGGLAQIFADTGADFDTLMQIALTEGNTGLVNYWQSLAETNDAAASLFHSGVVEWGIRMWESLKVIWGDLTSWSNFTNDLAASFGDVDAKLARESALDKTRAQLDSIWTNPVLKKNVKDFNNILTGTATQFSAVGTAAKQAAGEVPEFEDSVGGAGDAAEKAAQKIRTLKDYASDLKTIWERAFEIRFSGQQTLDAVKDSLQKFRDAAEASAKRVTDLRNSIRSLSADSQALKSDISILEYYLSIAREYGDTKRATALEAELAKKRAELAEKTSDLANKNKELKREQDSQNKTLTGNTQAARDNRKSILDLVQQYQSHIEALAKSGMSQKDLSAATQRLKDDFMKQATQLGYNRDEVKKYAASFDDVAVAIAKVPRNVTIEVKGINPAVAALREVEAAAKRANTQAGNLRNTLGKGLSAGGVNTSSITAAGYAAEAATLRKKLMDAAFAPTKAGKGNALAPYTETGLRSRLSQLSSMGYMNGGFTGRGPRDEIKGAVHGGEFVFRKDQVNQSTGLPTQAALLSMLPQGSLPSRSVAPAAPTGRGGPAQVSLTAGTIQAIAQAVDKILVVDGKLVAEATTRAFAYENTTGAY